MSVKISILVIGLTVFSAAIGQQTQDSPAYSESKAYTTRDPAEIYVGNKRRKEKVEKDAPVTVGDAPAKLSVSVLAAGAKFQDDLKAADFKLFVDDVETSITSIDVRSEPISVILVLDVSPSTSYTSKMIVEPALNILRQLRPGDHVMVVKFSAEMKVICDLTDDQALAEKAIRKSTGSPGNGTALYDTVRSLSEKVIPDIQGPKAVVLITDGVDTTSARARYETSLLAAEKTDTIFFPVYLDTFSNTKNLMLNGRTAPSTFPTGGGVTFAGESPKTVVHDYQVGRDYLNDLITLSGGRVIPDPELSNPASMADIVRERYVISFTLKGPNVAGQRHKLRLRVVRPALAVRTRGSIIVPDR